LRTVGPRYERSRFAALLDPEIDLTRQIAAFANTTGGFIVLGASIDPESGAPIDAAGIDHVAAGAAVRESLAKIDPPVDHLVSSRPIETPSSSVPLLFVSVSQSPSPPHLVIPEGQVLISVAEGVRHVQSRAELDALYQRGRSERELADRQIEAMIEKLVQAHYALYGIGFVACTQTPTAEPFLWARENPAALVEEMLPFSTDWGLTEETIKLRPAEIELRGERDATWLHPRHTRRLCGRGRDSTPAAWKYTGQHRRRCAAGEHDGGACGADPGARAVRDRRSPALFRRFTRPALGRERSAVRRVEPG